MEKVWKHREVNIDLESCCWVARQAVSLAVNLEQKKQWRTAVPDATEAKLALFYSKGDSKKIATASKQEKFMDEGQNNKHIKG
jgi:hypothetical protein